MARDYGDIVSFHVLMRGRILLNHPDWINQVLVIQQNKFHKSELTRRITARMLGQGLLISEGDFWRRRRRLVQPAFHRSRINEYAATMIENLAVHRDWRRRRIAQRNPGDGCAHSRHRRAHAHGTTLPGKPIKWAAR